MSHVNRGRVMFAPKYETLTLGNSQSFETNPPYAIAPVRRLPTRRAIVYVPPTSYRSDPTVLGTAVGHNYAYIYGRIPHRGLTALYRASALIVPRQQDSPLLEQSEIHEFPAVGKCVCRNRVSLTVTFLSEFTHVRGCNSYLPYVMVCFRPFERDTTDSYD